MKSFSKNSELFSVQILATAVISKLSSELLLVTPDTANIHLCLLELFSLNIGTLCVSRIPNCYSILKNPSPDHSIK